MLLKTFYILLKDTNIRVFLLLKQLDLLILQLRIKTLSIIEKIWLYLCFYKKKLKYILIAHIKNNAIAFLLLF